MRPIVLKPNNFTPATRTPWGGRHIIEKYKPFLKEMVHSHQVGESWEISVEPDFPSRAYDDGRFLSEIIRESPQLFLGLEAAEERDGTALLVKLLDADDNLSVQVHPSNSYEGLKSGESGKPESWFVLDRAKGAGLYLGFRSGIERSDVERVLSKDEDLSQLLNFVPVEPGDFFLIEAGTPHAIGKGITLIEPQHVIPGRRGLTYRFWDWNRKYLDDGRESPEGNPRSLHMEDALAVTRWDAPRGNAFLRSIHHRVNLLAPSNSARLTCLCGGLDETILSSPFLQVHLLEGTGSLALPPASRLVGVTLVQGELSLVGGDFCIDMTHGHSAVVPAALRSVEIRANHALAVLCSAL